MLIKGGEGEAIYSGRERLQCVCMYVCMCV